MKKRRRIVFLAVLAIFLCSCIITVYIISKYAEINFMILSATPLADQGTLDKYYVRQRNLALCSIIFTLTDVWLLWTVCVVKRNRYCGILLPEPYCPFGNPFHMIDEKRRL